ncbi:hypothetical protein, partial [Bacteroides caccae]|uniref:hypothetical protein n=1 Tax=Bacteroides caccae TaxID=47678 RepID=UPI00356A8C1F
KHFSCIDSLNYMHKMKIPQILTLIRVNHSVNRHQLMYKRKRHPRVEASQMPYSYQVAGPGIEPGTS